MTIWPNLFLVGAPRAGTTTLYDFLKRTKGIYMSNKKEPHYFSQSIEPKFLFKPIRDEKKYLDLFKDVKDEKIVGEASTTYLWDPKAHLLIHEKSPDAKIIILLRDPVQRAYSNYLLRISSGKTYSFSDSIKQALEAKNDFYKGVIIKGGFYAEQIKRYLDEFGSDRIKIIIFEEFIKEPRRIVKEVLEFLEINEETPKEIKLTHNILTKPRNKIAAGLMQNIFIRNTAKILLPYQVSEIIVRKIFGKEITKPDMPKKDKEFLEKLYQDDIFKLQKIISRKIPWKWIK